MVTGLVDGNRTFVADGLKGLTLVDPLFVLHSSPLTLFSFSPHIPFLLFLLFLSFLLSLVDHYRVESRLNHTLLSTQLVSRRVLST